MNSVKILHTVRSAITAIAELLVSERVINAWNGLPTTVDFRTLLDSSAL